MIDQLARTEGNPPLYFSLLDGWMGAFGTSEAAVRSLSALIGTATIPLAYAIGRRLATQRVGLVLAALVAFNPLLVWFSQEARPYALLVFLSGLSFLLFASALELPTRRRLAGWAVASGLALATHYFAGLLILPEAAWLIHRVRPRRDALLAVAGFAMVPLALIPLVASQGQVQDYSFVKGESLVTRVVAQVPKQWLVGYDAPAETLVVIAAAALSVVALWLAWRPADGRERGAARLGGSIGCRARDRARPRDCGRRLLPEPLPTRRVAAACARARSRHGRAAQRPAGSGGGGGDVCAVGVRGRICGRAPGASARRLARGCARNGGAGSPRPRHSGVADKRRHPSEALSARCDHVPARRRVRRRDRRGRRGSAQGGPDSIGAARFAGRSATGVHGGVTPPGTHLHGGHTARWHRSRSPPA